MFKFSEYLNGMPILDEELHPELQSAIDANVTPSHRIKLMSAAIRSALKQGHDTGLEDAKPKKGSSRAVFFPKDPHPINLDGHDTHVHTVLKVAFPGQLDKYNRSGKLLGEHQNLTEAEPFTNQHYGIITKHSYTGNWTTNHESGILPPMLDAHHEGHHLLVGRVQPIKAGDFRQLTKAEGFKKGISHDEMYHALLTHHFESHGKGHYGRPENMDELEHHPFINKMHNFITSTNQHPGDLGKRNMGVWEHPLTKERHLVVADYGYSHDVAKHYADARNNYWAEASRERRW